MDRWRGKVCLVTGASSGMGLQISKVLAAEGIHVIGCARRTHRLEKLAEEIISGGNIFIPITCDLSKEENIHSLFSQVIKNHGGVDICVNSAGYSPSSSLMDGTVTEWKNNLDVNLIATGLCTQLSIKSMKERNFDNGHIININSMSGHRIAKTSHYHFYACTKFGVTAITEGFRQELREMKSHIRITSISPTSVQTEFFVKNFGEKVANEIFTSQECLQAEDIAKVVKDILSSHPRAEINDIFIRPTEQLE